VCTYLLKCVTTALIQCLARVVCELYARSRRPCNRRFSSMSVPWATTDVTRPAAAAARCTDANQRAHARKLGHLSLPLDSGHLPPGQGHLPISCHNSSRLSPPAPPHVSKTICLACYGHSDQRVRLPACGFLLVFCIVTIALRSTRGVGWMYCSVAYWRRA